MCECFLRKTKDNAPKLKIHNKNKRKYFFIKQPHYNKGTIFIIIKKSYPQGYVFFIKNVKRVNEYISNKNIYKEDFFWLWIFCIERGNKFIYFLMCYLY
jgi:hypothetical protein